MKNASAGKANCWQPPMASSWTTNASLVGANQHPLQRRLANSGMKSSSAETTLWTGRENEMGTRAHRSPSRHPRQRHVPPQQKRHFRRDSKRAQCPWDCPDPCDPFIAPFHAWHTRSRRVIQVTPQSPDVLSLEETEHMFHDRIIVAPPTHLAKPGLSVVGFPVPSRPLSYHPVPPCPFYGATGTSALSTSKRSMRHILTTNILESLSRMPTTSSMTSAGVLCCLTRVVM